MEPVTDICFNPTSKQFTRDLYDVLERTARCKVNMIFASSGLHDCEATVRLAELYDQRCTVGVHPHWASDVSDLSDLNQVIRNHIDKSSVVAIGECGLDYYRMHLNSIEEKHRGFYRKQMQLVVFRRQMHLAKEYGVPVLLHSREAHRDFMEVLREYPTVRGVVHCFTGTVEELRDYLNHGLYVGLTTLICQTGRRGASIRSLVKSIPMNRLMLETDAPYMTPPVNDHDAKILKGRRNEPWTIQYALKTAADEYGITRKELSEQLAVNVRNLFT